VEFPGLTVFSNDGKLARLVVLLQETGDSLHMPRRLLLRSLLLPLRRLSDFVLCVHSRTNPARHAGVNSER
jgi:hypothetical protein